MSADELQDMSETFEFLSLGPYKHKGNHDHNVHFFYRETFFFVFLETSAILTTDWFPYFLCYP